MLVGVYEIAAMLNVTRQRVHQLATSDDFPEPLARLAMGAVWDSNDIEAWRNNVRPFSKKRGPQVPPRDPDRPQDDPWDADAVRYLMTKPEGAGWSRGELMECLREQHRRVERQPDRVNEAKRLASQHEVDRHADAGGKTIHFFRNDRAAPRPYPASATERRAWLRES